MAKLEERLGRIRLGLRSRIRFLRLCNIRHLAKGRKGPFWHHTLFLGFGQQTLLYTCVASTVTVRYPSNTRPLFYICFRILRTNSVPA